VEDGTLLLLCDRIYVPDLPTISSRFFTLYMTILVSKGKQEGGPLAQYLSGLERYWLEI